MTSRNLRPFLLLTSLLTGVAAGCGGGSSADSAGTPRAGAGAAVLRGEVTSLAGGLTVNGVTLDARGAVLRLPGEAPDRQVIDTNAELSTHLVNGMVVTVKDDGAGHAAEIEFEHALEGEVEAHGPGHVDVLGHHVSIDDATNVVDRHGGRLTPDDLSPGTRLEVSGHGDGRGGLRATMLRVRDDRPAAEAELKAWVVAVQGAVLDLSFARGGAAALQVDVSGVAPAPTVAVGALVEVKTTGARTSAGALVAVSLKHDDDATSGLRGEREVEGLVTALTASGFVVGDTSVSVSASTRYEGGTADDVVVGVKLEAEGTVGDDGVLAARTVKLAPAVRIEAKVEAKDEAGATLTVLGLTVHVTSSTEGAPLASLSIGAAIEVRGTMSRDGGSVNATRLQLSSSGGGTDRAFLRGPVTAKAGSVLTIAGVAVDVGGAGARDASGSAMSLDAFLAAVTPGRTLVKVRWRPSPTSTADAIDEAELERE